MSKVFASKLSPLVLSLGFVLYLLGCADESVLNVVGGGGDNPVEPESEPDPPAEYKLTVLTDPGVTVSPGGGIHTYTEGSEITFEAAAQAGFDHLTVVLDGVGQSASGLFVMDTSRTLYVSADPTTAVLPSDAVVQHAEDLLNSPDPKEAFQAYLDEIAGAAGTRISADSVSNLLMMVDRVVFDWAENGPAIRRLSQALDGQVFEYAPPSESSASPQAAGIAGIMSSNAEGPVEVEDTLARTVFIHVNGVHTTPAAAMAGMVQMAEAVAENQMAIRSWGESDWDDHGRVLYRLVYNHSFDLDLSDCWNKVQTEVSVRGWRYLASLASLSGGNLEERLGCDLELEQSTGEDFIEAFAQVVDIEVDGIAELWQSGYRPPAVDVLMGQTDLYRDRGYNVIMTGHSQGNLFVIQALKGLGEAAGESGQASCVGYIGIAPPAYTEYEYADVANAFIAGGERVEDILAPLPFPQPSNTPTELTQVLDDEWPTFLGFHLPDAGYYYAAGKRIHALTSYLHADSSATSREWVVRQIGEQYRHLAEACGGYISGRVLDGETGTPIEGAGIQILGATFRETSRDPETVAVTDAEGRFTTSMIQARANDFRVIADGYVEAEMLAVEPRPFETVQVAAIPLAPYSEEPGSIAGQITNSRTTAGVVGAIVELRAGANAGAGEVIASSTSDEAGYYQIVDVPAGTYSIYVSADDYVSESLNGIVIGGSTTSGQDIDLTPVSNDIVITLNWGQIPSDLDSHLEGPTAAGGRFHVYYASKGSYSSSPWAGLDVDDVSSYGPETVTITQVVDGGDYEYWVHDYSNRSNPSSTQLGDSGATVTVSRNGRLVRTYTVPAGQSNRWNVFKIVNNVLVDVNELMSASADVASDGASAPLLMEKK